MVRCSLPRRMNGSTSFWLILTDPIGPAAALYAEQFYRAADRALAPDGILVTQSGSPLLMGAELGDAYRKMLAGVPPGAAIPGQHPDLPRRDLEFP